MGIRHPPVTNELVHNFINMKLQAGNHVCPANSLNRQPTGLRHACYQLMYNKSHKPVSHEAGGTRNGGSNAGLSGSDETINPAATGTLFITGGIEELP